jgi:hypothetical protein
MAQAMSYVLIVTIIHGSIGAVDTQHVTGFDSYSSCAEHGVAWADTQPLNPADERIRWYCERGE